MPRPISNSSFNRVQREPSEKRMGGGLVVAGLGQRILANAEWVRFIHETESRKSYLQRLYSQMDRTEE